MATSAIKGVKRSYRDRDGAELDELSCGHNLPSLWDAVRKHVSTPTTRFCRHCYLLIDPWNRIPTEDTLFTTEIEKGFTNG